MRRPSAGSRPEADELRDIALRLAEADAAAFAAVAEVYQLPKSTEADRAARSAAMARAWSTRPGRRPSSSASPGWWVDLAEMLAEIGNRTSSATSAPAAEAARAAAATARMNVEINLAGITD